MDVWLARCYGVRCSRYKKINFNYCPTNREKGYELMKEIDALFGDVKDAYTVLQGETTTLDPNDTAIVLTENEGMQLFLPENGEISDRGLAMVEIYNALCRDKAGPVNKKTKKAIPENVQYDGFTKPFTDKMRSRVE